MEDYLGFIYVWTNKLNGKKYIGLHSGKIDDGYIGSGILFKQSVEKHGIENFHREIVYYEYDNIDNLYNKEHEIINECNAVSDNNYYNLRNYYTENMTDVIEKRGRSGKDNNMYGKSWYTNGIKDFPYKKDEVPDGWWKGMTNIRRGKDNHFYGKIHTEESRYKMSKNTLKKYGEDNPFYGKTHTEETRKKMSESNTGTPKTISKERRLYLKESISGKNNPNYNSTIDDLKNEIMELDKLGLGQSEILRRLDLSMKNRCTISRRLKI